MRYEDWTFREAEVREHRELRQTLGLTSARFHDAVSFLAAAERSNHRPGGWRDRVPVARHAEKESPASQGRRGRDGLGARSGQHVFCAAPASPRAKTVALAALVEVVCLAS